MKGQNNFQLEQEASFLVSFYKRKIIAWGKGRCDGGTTNEERGDGFGGVSRISVRASDKGVRFYCTAWTEVNSSSSDV